MSILFLDFDGVLNNQAWIQQSQERGFDMIDPSMVARLNRIVDTTGCQVVVSSSWRILYPIDAMRVGLRERGFTGHLSGATPHGRECDRPLIERARCRGDEIEQWLCDNGQCYERIAIVDDDADMRHLLHRLVKTTFQDGLTEAKADEVIAMLNRGMPHHGWWLL